MASNTVDPAPESEVFELLHVHHAIDDAGVAIEAKVLGSQSHIEGLDVRQCTEGTAHKPGALGFNVVEVEVAGEVFQPGH